MPVVLKTKEARVCVTSTSVRWDRFSWLFLQFPCTCSHSHTLCLPVTLSFSWLACLSSNLSAADVNGSRQHVLFATCVLLPVSQWVRLIFPFFQGIFLLCLSQSLDLSHIKSLLHVLSFGSLVSSMQRTCPVQQKYAFIRLLQQCLCNHFAELCYS